MLILSKIFPKQAVVFAENPTKFIEVGELWLSDGFPHVPR